MNNISTVSYFNNNSLVNPENAILAKSAETSLFSNSIAVIGDQCSQLGNITILFFSSVFSVLQRMDSILSFPVAYAAKTSSIIENEIKFLNTMIQLTENGSELADANTKMRILLDEIKKQPNSPIMDFSDQFASTLIDIVDLIESGPVAYIFETALSKARELQLDIAIEGIEKIKNLKVQNENQLNIMHARKKRNAEIQSLRNQLQQLAVQYDAYDQEETNKVNTYNGVQKELQQKMTQYDQLDARIAQLYIWMAKVTAYLPKRVGDMKAYNEEVQKYKHQMSTSQLEEASRKNTEFQQEMSNLQPRVVKFTTEMNDKVKECETVRESLVRLTQYLKETEQSIIHARVQAARIKAQAENIHKEL